MELRCAAALLGRSGLFGAKCAFIETLAIGMGFCTQQHRQQTTRCAVREAACRAETVLVAKESSSLTHWRSGMKTGCVSNLIASMETEKGGTGGDASPEGIVFLYSLTCFQALSNTPVLFPARLLQR